MTKYVFAHRTSATETPKVARGRVGRRDRIIVAAMSLAAHGYEHCQIRAVAAAAGIAPSTVYLYFPSKDDLLLACLHRWLSDFEISITAGFEQYPGGYARLLRVFEDAAFRLSSSPRLAEALIRPYLFVQGSFTEEADTVRPQILRIFGNAMGDGYPAALRQSVTELFADVWVTNISAVAQRRTTLSELMHGLTRVATAIDHRNGLGDPMPSVCAVLSDHGVSRPACVP